MESGKHLQPIMSSRNADRGCSQFESEESTQTDPEKKVI